MIAVVDYGVGNLFSLTCSLRYIGAEARVTGDAEDLRAADGIILPGVGAFADARAKLRATGLEPVLREQVEAGKPLLGICLGMQMLFDRSFEYGEHEGLGLIRGDVVPFDLPADMKVPHMGWNSLHILKPCPLLARINEGDFVYYVHSYYATGCAEDTVAVWLAGMCTERSSTPKRAAKPVLTFCVLLPIYARRARNEVVSRNRFARR